MMMSMMLNEMDSESNVVGSGGGHGGGSISTNPFGGSSSSSSSAPISIANTYIASAPAPPTTKPGEVILRKLFHEFTILADKKIETVLGEPLERPLAKSLQRGEDAIFDQLLIAFGSVAEHCLPSQLRILFEWHEKQLSATGKFIDDNLNASQQQHQQQNQPQSSNAAATTTTTTATSSSIKSATDSQSSTKSSSNVPSISSVSISSSSKASAAAGGTNSSGGGGSAVGGIGTSSGSSSLNYPTHHHRDHHHLHHHSGDQPNPILDAEINSLLEKRDLSIEFIFCLVLIEILKQLHLHPGYEELTAHIENLAFKHFKFHEDAQSKPNLQNINMIADLYAEVIGVLAQSRFQSVRKRFMLEFKELRAKEPSPITTHNIISLLMGMKFFRIKMVPIEEFEASFLFMQECAVYFLDVKDKDIKHALAGLFVEILVPVAATVKNEVNVPCLKNFVELLYSQTLDLCTKKKHGLALFPLVTCLLCVSQKTFFLTNWHYFLAMCLSHLKNRDPKMSRVALESLYRLLWVYMIRIKCESNTATQSRLHSIVNSLFPKGSKAVVPRDTPLNIFVKIIQFIAQERLDFAMKEIVFDLLSVGRAIKIILTPERMSIGLRSFLVVADSLQQKDGEPPMPRTVGVLPSGNTLRVKKTFLNKMLTDEMAKNIGMNHYYPYVRKTFSDILRALDIQFGRPLMMTNLQNLNKEPDDMITGERKPKIDLFRTCVAAIPRLIPDGISKSDLIDLLARLTVHMDEEMNVLAFQSLQNLVVDFADWREEVIDGFVHFILLEINDSFQGLIENALRMLFQLLTSWRNSIQQQQQQTAQHHFHPASAQQQRHNQSGHSGAGSGNLRFSGNNNANQNALNTASPTNASASQTLTPAKMDQIANVLYNVDALALVMLCYCRQPTRRLAAYILKESRTISNLLLTIPSAVPLLTQLPPTSSSSSPSPGSAFPASSTSNNPQQQQPMKVYDEPVASIIDSHCPLIIEQSFPYISTNEKATIIALSYQVDLQWLAERSGNSWVFDDINQSNSKTNSGGRGGGGSNVVVGTGHHIGSSGSNSSSSISPSGINSVIDRKSSNTTLLNVVNSQTLLNTANLLQETSAVSASVSTGTGSNLPHPISPNITDQSSSSSLLSENSADSELKLNAWNVCLMSLMNEVSQKCPNAVALAWPIICQRLNTLFTHIDPNPANDNRASLILRGGSTSANLKRSISSFDRSFYLELWKNYLMFACRIAPSSIITPETAFKYYPNHHHSGNANSGATSSSGMQDNCVSPDSSLLESVKSSMSDSGTASASSRSPIANRGISAQALFKQVLPLIRCDQCDLRNAVILGLSQVNHFAFADLLENLVPYFREAIDKKQENLRRRKRREMLRVQIGRLFKYIAERKIFTHCPVVLDRDNGLMSFGSIVVEYIDGVRLYFETEPDKESNHHFVQDIKESYCHFVCNLLKNFQPEARANKLSRELRQNLFQMFASWSGRFGSMFLPSSNNNLINYDQMICFQSITELEYLSIRSMSAVLTSGSIFDVKNLLVDGNNLYYWLTNLLNASDKRINDIGLETLILLLENNLDDSGPLLEWLIECCYRKSKKIADACFTALATIFSIREYPCDRYIAIIIVTIVNVACPRIEIQQLALQLLQLLDNRFFSFPPTTSLNNNNNNSCNVQQSSGSNSSSQTRLQPYLAAEQQQQQQMAAPMETVEPLLLNLYPCSQYNISKRMANLHPQLTMIVFSEITFRFQTARPTVCQNLLHFLIPWLYNMQLVDSTNLSANGGGGGGATNDGQSQFTFHSRFDSGPYLQESFGGATCGGGWGSIESTEMVLNNLFFITIKFGDDYANELERVWAALCLNRPNNLKIIIRYLFILTGLAPNELLPYAKRIAIYLARSQPEHVIDELMTELHAVEFLSFNAERTEAFPYFRIINRKCSATHLDSAAGTGNDINQSTSVQNRKSADRENQQMATHSQQQSANQQSANQQQPKPEIGMLHTKRHSKDLQAKYDTGTTSGGGGGGGSDGSTKILLDQYRNNYDNFMANGGNGGGTIGGDEYNPILESAVSGILGGTELGGYFNPTANNNNNTSSNSNNDNSLPLSERNYSTTTKPSTPQPRPLPMPEYGGYYAPLNIFLLNPNVSGSSGSSGGGGNHHFGSTNINGTVNSSNIGFHRCNLALMLLCDIITQDISVDWSPHIPLMLHILFLGMDHSKPIVYEHCKQLLLNLLIVTCKHRDNLNVARILLNNRIQQQNYGLTATYSTFPYNFNNSSNLNESTDSTETTTGNGTGTSGYPGDNSGNNSNNNTVTGNRHSDSNTRINNPGGNSGTKKNGKTELDLNQIFTKSTENVFNVSMMTGGNHQSQLSSTSASIGGQQLDSSGKSSLKSTLSKNRQNRSNSKQLYVNLNEIHLNIMNEEQETVQNNNNDIETGNEEAPLSTGEEESTLREKMDDSGSGGLKKSASKCHLRSSNSIKRTKFSLDLYIKTLIDFISSKRNRQLWNYEDITAKLWQIRSAEQMSCFVEHVLFVFKESLPYAKIENRWADIALQLALSCSSRHYAGRSLQIFRALKIPINSRMLSDILSRLVETVSEQGEDMQGYVTELMLTLESAIDSFDFRPRNILDLINEYFHFDNIDTDEFDDDDDGSEPEIGVDADDEDGDIRLNDTQIMVDDTISLGDQLLMLEREQQDINQINNIDDQMDGSNNFEHSNTTNSSSSTLTVGTSGNNNANLNSIPNSQSQIECSLKMLNKTTVPVARSSSQYSMSFPSRRISSNNHNNQHHNHRKITPDLEQNNNNNNSFVNSTPNSTSHYSHQQNQQHYHHQGSVNSYYYQQQQQQPQQRFRPTIPISGGDVDYSFYSQKKQIIRSKCNSLTSVATCGGGGGRSQSVQSFNNNNNSGKNKVDPGSNDPNNNDNMHNGYLMDVEDDDDKNSILAQFFWISVIMLETDYEHEFLLALRVLDKVLDKLSLDDNDCQEKIEKIFVHFKWHCFPGVHALLLKGCASPGNYEPTINLLHKLTGYLKIAAIDPTKSEVSFPFHVMAMLPYLLHNYDDPNELCIQAAVSFAQWCNENSTKLENLATVMTLYSKRCFSKENSQWTKCVVKYLYDAFPGSFVQIISFLVEVAEKGPPVFLNHILSILHFMLNYIDLSTARLINAEIIRVAGRYIEGPQWKDALKILKLAVTRSSSLAAPSYSSSGSGYPSSIISSIVSGGTVGSAGAGSTGAYSDCISIASSSFAESEFSSFKRELPGRTMDFTFDLSQMPIVGLKFIRKRQNLENNSQLDSNDNAEARSKRDEYVVNELILGRVFDSDDETTTATTTIRENCPNRGGSGVSRPSQIGLDSLQYSLKRNNQGTSAVAQIRIRERLIGLLNRCGQRIGGLPKSPSVIFSQNSDIIEQINKSSMASSVEELSTTNNDISGDSKHDDHSAHHPHGGEFAFFKEFDFLEYELESQEGESLDNFNWGVRRKSLSNLDNETLVAGSSGPNQLPGHQQQQGPSPSQSNIGGGGGQIMDEVSELKQQSNQSQEDSSSAASNSNNGNNNAGGDGQQQSIVVDPQSPLSKNLKQLAGNSQLSTAENSSQQSQQQQNVPKDDYSSDDEVESSVSPSLYDDNHPQHPHHHHHAHHHQHTTPAPPTTPVVHNPLPPGLNNEIEEQWSTHFIQLINDNSGTTSAISNQILSLIFKNTFTRVIYLTRESCELLQQTAVASGGLAISDQYRTIANRFMDLIDIISTQIDFPFVFIDPKLFTTIPKLLEKHRFRILELHAQWETFNEKKDFLYDCICQSRNQLNGGEYSVAKLCKHLYKMYFQLFLLFECYLKFVDVLKSVTTFPQIVNCSDEITTLKKELVKSIEDPLLASLTVDVQFESTIDSKLSKENEAELKELITSKQFGKAIRFIRTLKTNISDFMGDDCIETLLTVYCKSLFETQSYYLVITEPEYNLSEITRQLMDASYVIYNDLCVN